jgi:hypothetical protein
MSLSLPMKFRDPKFVTAEMQRIVGASSEERRYCGVDGAPAEDQPHK